MKKTLAILGLMFVFAPFVIFAQQSAPAAPASPNLCDVRTVMSSGDRISYLPRCINQIYQWSLGIGVLLALLMMVVGGYYIMTAAGNAEQATKGKEYITGAIIGVIILFTAYLILNQINPDLVNFNLDSVERLQNPQPSGGVREGGGRGGGGGGR